jgi:hypothetical protein
MNHRYSLSTRRDREFAQKAAKITKVQPMRLDTSIGVPPCVKGPDSQARGTHSFQPFVPFAIFCANFPSISGQSR